MLKYIEIRRQRTIEPVNQTVAEFSYCSLLGGKLPLRTVR